MYTLLYFLHLKVLLIFPLTNPKDEQVLAQLLGRGPFAPF